jgi:hypothetical protein
VDDDALVRNARYIRKLLAEVSPPGRASIESVHAALVAVDGVEPGPRRGHSDGVEWSSSSQALISSNGGAAYRAECVSEGVPVPTTILDSSWTSHGSIALPFLAASEEAEIWSWESSSPDGVCVALPRWENQGTMTKTDDVADVFGIICLGRTTGKTCFFDNPNNPNHVRFPRLQVLNMTDFYAGAQLATNGQGVCSDCHAGENPFVVHPADSAFASLLAARDLQPLAWPDPIVPPGWPENPGPINRLGRVAPSQSRCDDCHGGVGGGGLDSGRFPAVSLLLPGYCGTVLNGAVGNTMPVGGSVAQYQDHVNWLQDACQTSPGTVVSYDVPASTGFLSPPILTKPIYGCATRVEVSGAQLDATLRLFVDGSPVGSRTVRNPASEIFSVGSLGVGQLVEVDQVVGVDVSAPDSFTVRDHNLDFPTGVDAPSIDPTTIHECGRSVAVRHPPGATVRVTKAGPSGNEVRTFATGGGWTYTLFSNAFMLGDSFVAEATYCTDPWSSPSDVEYAKKAPTSLPEVEFYSPEDLYEGQELVHMHKIAEGASLSLSELSFGPLWGLSSWPVSWVSYVDVATPLGSPLQTSHTLVPEQSLCGVTSPTASAQYIVQDCSELGAPVIATPVDGDDFVIVLEAVPGATIRVFDSSGTEIGNGSGWVVALTRSLSSGETITAVQEVGNCTPSTGFRATVP